jgi:hypothetical protein
MLIVFIAGDKLYNMCENHSWAEQIYDVHEHFFIDGKGYLLENLYHVKLIQ